MADPFIAEVRIFGFNFAPTGWAQCNGQLVPISQNTALFSLLGTAYGGDGRLTFALPNLQDALAIGAGAGLGLTPRAVGESGGSATVALTVAQMPAHGHALMAGTSPASNSPAAATVTATGTGAPAFHSPAATTTMAGTALAAAGQGQPHENRPPSLALNFCIALQGVFPARS